MDTPEFHVFFRNLANRFRHETHLSDITFTALITIPGFKRDFIRFFFSDIEVANEDEIEVIREGRLQSGDGQPDFILRGSTWDLLVENKIEDRNYHFQQYGKEPLSEGRPIPRVGLLANHPVSQDGIPAAWKVRHWQDFAREFSNKDYGVFRPLFRSYLEYVKRICDMTDFTNFKFDLKSLPALTHFVRMVETVITTTRTQDYNLEVVPRHRLESCGETWAGKFFKIITKNGVVDLSLILCLGFELPHEISIGIDARPDQDWRYFKKVADHLPGSMANVYEGSRWPDANMVTLKMPSDSFRSLNDLCSKDEQMKQLRTFLTSCCDAILAAASTRKPPTTNLRIRH